MKYRMLIPVFPLLLFSVMSYGQLKINYERFVLDNGLQVILHEDHSVPSVTVNVWYHVGSGSEKPGRTGFAHLFEHLMFEGSGNVQEGKFDEWLEAAGGDNNGSTTPDRTNYYENLPSNALELALFLESDRMGYLLNAMTPSKVDGQRDVVKNERRQSYENRPYGLAWPTISENLYPPDFPYHWPTIGSMADLTAASYQDVVEFFKKYYVPNNASLVIAGDINPAEVKKLVHKWFDEIPAGNVVMPVDAPVAYSTEEKRLLMEDKVQLPRIYITWQTPPRFAPGDAELDILANILAGGKNSRLYKKLVYDMQIAQDVNAFSNKGVLSSGFYVIVTARSGHTLAEIEKIIQEEISKIKQEAPAQRELERAVNQYEAGFLDALENIGDKADQLNDYYVETGNPDYFNEDLSRYKALDRNDISTSAQTFLRDNSAVVLSIVPEGKKELAAVNSKEVKK